MAGQVIRDGASQRFRQNEADGRNFHSHPMGCDATFQKSPQSS
jgi:hypothetical protein